MMEKERSLTFFLILLFIVGTLPITNPVSADGEIDNWPENDAWLHIELISWSANETVEWDNNGGLPDPIFKICIEADGDNLDCVNTPTWENQMTLNNSWNYSIDIPDHTNILNITIECEDNDALNDDECDMNSELDEWKLYAEYNWSATPTLTVSGNGDGDGNDTWKNAASTWKFTIDGFGDEDSDGVPDNIDLCAETAPNSIMLSHQYFIGCSWNQLDSDADNVSNGADLEPFNQNIGLQPNHGASLSEWASAEVSLLGSSSPNGAQFGGRPLVMDVESDGVADYIITERLELVKYPNDSTYGSLDEFQICEFPNGYSAPYEYNLDDCQTPSQSNLGHSYSHVSSADLNYDGDVDFIDGGQINIYREDGFFTQNYSLSQTNYPIVMPFDFDKNGLIELASINGGGNGITGFRIFTSDIISDPSPRSIHDDASSIMSCNWFNTHQDMVIKYEENSGSSVVLCYRDGTHETTSTGSGYINQTGYIFWIDNLSVTKQMNVYSHYHGSGLGGLADINQDGWIDYISNPEGREGQCTVSLGNGVYFEQPIDIGEFGCSSGVKVLDLDGDGDLDISSDYGLAFENDGFYEYFNSHSGELGGSNFWGPHALADLDADGDLDRIVGHPLQQYQGDLVIYWNPSYLDADEDGIKDMLDICPYTELQLDVDSQGCSASQRDSDDDSINDDIDLCPSTLSSWTVDDDGCAAEQLDDDEDGLNNALDECPDTPEGDLVNIRGCSFEDSQDLDSDNDGVLDSEDACPNTPADVTVDSIGCDLDGNQTADTDSDGDGVYDSQDECANTPAGATADFKGCPMDSDYDGVYDGIDECPSSNNPAPSDMDKSSEVDSTGCFIDAAEGESDSGSAASGCLGMIVMIGVVVFVVRKVRSPKQEQVLYAQTQSVRYPVQQQFVPTPQVSSRERELEHQSRQAQIEAQRLRQQLANQAQITQQLQREAAQKQMSEAALAQKQHELAVAQQEKEELEAKLAEAEKNTPIVQNITYNIQDSAISGDITNKITRNDSE